MPIPGEPCRDGLGSRPRSGDASSGGATVSQSALAVWVTGGPLPEIAMENRHVPGHETALTQELV